MGVCTSSPDDANPYLILPRKGEGKETTHYRGPVAADN